MYVHIKYIYMNAYFNYQYSNIRFDLSQPHLEGNVRSPLTLPKTQNVIVGVKTPRIEVFFIVLERS
jgi:hypothetical protein